MMFMKAVIEPIDVPFVQPEGELIQIALHVLGADMDVS